MVCFAAGGDRAGTFGSTSRELIAYGRRRRRQVVVAPTCAAPAAAGSECRPRRGSVRASWRRTHAARRRLLARREMVSVVLVWGMGSV